MMLVRCLAFFVALFRSKLALKRAPQPNDGAVIYGTGLRLRELVFLLARSACAHCHRAISYSFYCTFYANGVGCMFLFASLETTPNIH